MTKDEELQELAEAVKALFRVRPKEFRSDDFVKVANLMGFHAHEKGGSGEGLKPVAENYLPDLIGTNLQYAVEAYVWETHVPMTDDGAIVSGFFDTGKAELPEGC
ncbi:MAG: hypothetical protein KAH06_05665 [Desulfobacterales bacterium]|nr:hypothetical protein [Desulfobacterales bacterium]